MMSDEAVLSRLIVVGASHRTSPEAMRDRLFIAEEDVARLLHGICAADFTNAVALSTCARTEIFGLASDMTSARESAVSALAELGGVDVKDLSPQTYFYEAEDALRHLLRVSASLDSPIIGEPEVTGQFRDAVRAAETRGFLGAELNSIVQAVYRTSKRVRTKTVIGQRSVSIAACATQVASDVQGDLARVKALLITGGEMGELIADHLRNEGLSQLTLMARSRARAEISARRYDCHFAVLDDLPKMLSDADIVITSLGAGQYLFSPEGVSAALAARRLRPMLFIDAAIPSDVDPAVNDLEGAFAYSLDDFERIALEGRFQRDEALAEAELIIEEGLHEYLHAAAERNAVPAVLALRQHFENIRQSVLADVGDDTKIDEVTRRLTNRLLHNPSEALRNLATVECGTGPEMERLIKLLFNLCDNEDNTREQ